MNSTDHHLTCHPEPGGQKAVRYQHKSISKEHSTQKTALQNPTEIKSFPDKQEINLSVVDLS